LSLERWLSRGLVLCLLALGGCPAVLDDNFSEVPGSVDAGNAGRGGLGSSAGPGDGGAPDTGGINQGGNAGKPPMAGSSNGGSAPGGMGPLGGAGDGGASNVDPCAACSPEECCDGECVDLSFDAKNCHSCGHGCPGTTCDNSSCTNTCAQGFIDCNKNVADGCEVNSAADPKNCGNCGIACGFQMVCMGGVCMCPTGTADCDGQKENGCETDISSDSASCGQCFKACGAGQHCVASACSCQVGFADCNLAPEDGCEASLTGDHSCGSCALDCQQHSKCVAAGDCDCAPGYLDCDSGVPGCETPITDPNHCGSCTNVCSAQTPACDGTSCNTGCGALTRCGSSCVDTQVDLQNCGGCGKAVGLNQTCVAGKPSCVAGFGDCDANPADCETNTDTDAAHCGTCAIACKSGARCTAGSCGCAPATPNDCGASCQQCCNDQQCSDGDSCTADTCNNGSCGSGQACAGGGTVCCAGTGCFACCGDSDCAPGKVCSGNQCVNLTCPAPQIVCNNKCVDPTNDAKNCGSCGLQCGLSRTCASSACTPRWVRTADPLAGFVARERAAYTAMGSKVFIWGGLSATSAYLADGATYDPDTDTWAAIGATGAPPSARVAATAVWTGSVVVVWGGGNASSDLSSGSRYDPLTNSWTAITTVGAPTGRRGSYGFWTGSRVLIWGGVDRNGNASSAGALYDPVNDKWTTFSTTNAPTVRNDPTVAWLGSVLAVYGGDLGASYSSKIFLYNPGTNAWSNGVDGPLTRYGSLGTWDGTYFTAWSGASPLKTDGKYYEPVGDKWTTMSTTSQPAARWAPNRQTGWSAAVKPGVTLMVGGMGANTSTFFTNGGLFNSTTNAWTTVAAWPSGYSHLYGVGVWSGTEFVVWGGRTVTGSTLTAVGERYRP
jgi:hypothetical protein